MEPDRESDSERSEEIQVDLDPETEAHYQERARAAGRTLSEQICYELLVNRGMLPDPGDTEGRQRGQLFSRIFRGRLLTE